ncbi:hypothetical protein GCM10017708_37630 [Arthrobacter citreus]|nr:hypothetical protein [Arthrobacter gandavensis]
MARRQTPEQVIAKVRQGQKMLNNGHPVIEVIKELQVTEATCHKPAAMSFFSSIRISEWASRE